MAAFSFKPLKTLSITFLLSIFLLSASPVRAEILPGCGNDFGVTEILFNGNRNVPNEIPVGSITSYTLTISGNSFSNGDTYALDFRAGIGGGITNQEVTTAVVSSNTLTFTVNQDSVLKGEGQKTLQLRNPAGTRCDLLEYDVSEALTCDSITLTQAGFENPGCFDQQSGTINVTATGLKVGGETYSGNTEMNLSGAGSWVSTATDGTVTFPYLDPAATEAKQGYSLTIMTKAGGTTSCQTSIDIQSAACSDESRDPVDPADPDETSSFELCDQIVDTSMQTQCRTCATKGEAGSSGQGGVWTAVGCISRDPVDIAQRLIEVGLGMGGGVALLMTLAGGFILSTSQGDPQKANQAREMITNSVIGLLFVIFSVVILQFIGVTILRIPGFGANTSESAAP